jgi:hypothetical protein
MDMDIRVSLQYPNGRIHEATVVRDTPLEPGEQFLLHGRNWRAISRTRKTRRPLVGGDAPMLCRSN